jgi:hypothetical protein
VDLKHSILQLRKDGLILLYCNDNHAYCREEVIENHETIRKICPDEKAFVLNIAGKYTSAQPDAKKYTASGIHVDFIGAEAFVINNLAQRILAQFYFKIYKPKVKSDYFTDFKKAENWLIKQRNNAMKTKKHI